MPDLHLPNPTTANERLWPIQLEPKYQVFVNSLLEKNGWKHHGADWFQPLFSLTAKDATGKVRTVVEGDILLHVSGEVGVLNYDKEINAFVVQFVKDNWFQHAMKEVMEHMTVLCHATDIMAAGNKIDCWQCRDSFGSPSPEVQKIYPCPTCHGEGQHKIIWKE